jgi:hypothetical protein
MRCVGKVDYLKGARQLAEVWRLLNGHSIAYQFCFIGNGGVGTS